ncbi:hypothetical protein CK203_010463 [Vitis vinifera]|uniref:Uncharacterized protein n=1 Tax=Vitis vinifera TaxID=29760 RepID=A0A438JTL4_VITVI|nr:hypothetical protein CK203_010463 [Vitis vinifera]
MYCVAVLLTLHAVPSEPLLKGPSLSMQHMVLHPTDPNTEKDSMISPKNLIRIARKWQKVAALGRKRILLQRFNRGGCRQLWHIISG